MRYVVGACLAVLSAALAGCGSPPPAQPAGHANAAPSANPAAAVVNAPAHPIVRRFVGIPMPPNNILDVDRTVIVGGDNDWLGRILLSAPMTVDQTIEFYHHDMPRFGWTELAVTRSDTSVMAYQMGERIATIQLTPAAGAAGTKVELWVNPLHPRAQQQAAQPGNPLVRSAPMAEPPPIPQIQVDGQRAFPAPPPRAVEQAPLPPLNSP